MVEVQHITIIGTGLLGGSIGLALRAQGYTGRIVGVGRRLETAQRAQALGCIDQAFTDILPAAADGDLVILATPIGAFAAIFTELAGLPRPHPILTDVGSTKAHVCNLAGQLLPAPLARRFVGAHPMAGSEAHGPDAACADLFRGKPCILTPQSATDPVAVATVEWLWKTLGMRLLRMDAATHDRLVAQISHLPHALAVLLVQMAVADGGLDLASTGFRDTTRIASSDPALWADVFLTNRPAVLAALDAYAGRLRDLRAILEAADRLRLREILQSSKRHRDQWVQRQWSEE